MESYFPEAGMVKIEPTSDDIGRYIEERLKEDLDVDVMDQELRADIRRVIPKRISGMHALARDVGFHKLG